MSASEADSLKEGWMLKKGSFVRSWKRRYFILTPSALQYFTDESKTELKGYVPIVHTSRVMHRDGSSHQFKFGLLTGKRLLEIACESDELRTSWKTTIQELINRLQLQGSRAGAGGGTAPQGDKGTIFDDLIVKNRLERTHMVEDTPMNRARKKQQQQQQQQQKEKQGKSLPGTVPGAGAVLQKDEQEGALWGGGDSDVSEESESEEDEQGGRAPRPAASKSKLGSRRRLAGSGSGGSKARKAGTGGGERALECGESASSSSAAPDLQGLSLEEEGALDGWDEFVSDKGEVYYYHRGAKATRWEKPTREVTEGINQRLREERRQLESATEKRMLEQKHKKFVEEELQDYTNNIQSSVTQQILLWKHPPGKKRPRVLGELLNATPALLGPSVVPPDCSLAAQPLLKTDPPALVKKAYRQAVRLVHPDKIAGTGSVIDMEKKMLAAEVFIAISEAFEKFRQQHEDM